MTFLQLHTLTSYPAALLNRDDVGFAKRLPFGGATRLRISSQCLKRHWRTFAGDGAIRDAANAPELSVRSRLSLERYVYDALVAGGVDAKIAGPLTRLMEIVATQSGDTNKLIKKWEEVKKTYGKDAGEGVRTDQPTVFGKPELEFLRDEARQLAGSCQAPEDVWETGKEFLKAREYSKRAENLRVLGKSAGLDAALFGRMVTSDVFAQAHAAIHVAHAFSVHEAEAESDYFSVVDDLAQKEGEAGSGHINNSELTSGLYYGYVVVDVPLLVSNLEGGDRKDWRQRDRELAAEVVRRLAHLIPTVSPGAKLGSTAPYAYSHFVLAEWGTAQPRTLANAFDAPVKAHGDVLANAYSALIEYVGEIDEAYGRKTERRCVAIRAPEALGKLGAEKVSLDQLADFCAEKVTG